MRRPPISVDSSKLTGEGAEELQRLVGLLRRGGAPAPAANKARDAMTYELTIEDEGKQTVVRQTDVARTEAFTVLINWIRQQAR